MIQQGEIIVLLVGLIALIFILSNRRRLKGMPAVKLLISGFVILLGGWIFTVVEGLVWYNILNVIEHICYVGSSVMIALWCWKMFGKNRREQP
jgi:hypothetical protein